MKDYEPTQQEIEFVNSKLGIYQKKLLDQVIQAILEAEACFSWDAEAMGFNYPINPASTEILTVFLIQEMLDFLCEGDDNIAVAVLTNEAKRLNIRINT